MPIGSGLDVEGVPIATDGASERNLESGLCLCFNGSLGGAWVGGGEARAEPLFPRSCSPSPIKLLFFLRSFYSLSPGRLGGEYWQKRGGPGYRAYATRNVNSEILAFICISSASHLHSLHLRSNWADISTSPALSLVCIPNLSLTDSLIYLSVVQFLTLPLLPASSLSREGRGHSLAKGERIRSLPLPLDVW